MKPIPCLIAGFAPVVVILLFILIAVGLGSFSESGVGEDPGGSGAVAVGGSGWQVVRLPPGWAKFNDPTKLEEMRQTMQEMVDKYQLPADEFMAILDKESSGNPKIVNTSSGATGLGQFMPGTAEQFEEFGPAGQRAANRTNPIMAVKASAHKFSDDRKSNGGVPGGTLREAYVGIRVGRGFKGPAYNPGVDHATWDGPLNGKSIKEKAVKFVAEGYVVYNPVSSVANNTGSLSPANLKQISQTMLGIEYSVDQEKLGDSLGDDNPRCLNCQTFVETVMSIALDPVLGGREKAIKYSISGATGRGRISTPIPGWLHPPNGWPAVEATRDVARSSGIESSVAKAHWVDYGGGLGNVKIDYIPWDKVPELKGNDEIDGTIICYIGDISPGPAAQSHGVTHVGFIFNNNGVATVRHSTDPVVVDVDLAARARQPRGKYIGIIILRPDITKLKR